MKKKFNDWAEEFTNAYLTGCFIAIVVIYMLQLIF